MKKKSTAYIWISLLVTAALTALVWYAVSPALNIHSIELWVIVLGALLLLSFLLAACESDQPKGKKRRVGTFTGIVTGVLLLVLAVGALLGTKLFHAGRYASLAQQRIEYRDFLEDVPEEGSVTNIALMDTASAQIIGNRQMGSLSTLVSQFETSDYSTITLNERPMKVSALQYAGFFRYLRNADAGVPGYIQVDPVTQKATYVELSEGMKYVPSAAFGYDLKRHVHSQYPDAILGSYFFELDEEGTPWYICPYYEYRAGLFGLKDVGGAILVNPVTGEMERYALSDVPAWVDRVYDGDLLCEQYDNYGRLRNGLMNSLFAKVGCVVTTEDYGYKALEGDIWVFTGVTSVASDESNIGFVLMNSRTGEIRYYDVYGAEEFSAMSAAEGQVQNLRYTAAFPSVVNVGGEPVYIMVLKDSGGLTKMYALVNVQDYSLVATGETQAAAMAAYRARVGGSESLWQEVTVAVEDVRTAVIDGNTYLYLISGEKAYKLLLSENEAALFLKAGDTVALRAEETDAQVIRAALD